MFVWNCTMVAILDFYGTQGRYTCIMFRLRHVSVRFSIPFQCFPEVYLRHLLSNLSNICVFCCCMQRQNIIFKLVGKKRGKRRDSLLNVHTKLKKICQMSCFFIPLLVFHQYFAIFHSDKTKYQNELSLKQIHQETALHFSVDWENGISWGCVAVKLQRSTDVITDKFMFFYSLWFTLDNTVDLCECL